MLVKPCLVPMQAAEQELTAKVLLYPRFVSKKITLSSVKVCSFEVSPAEAICELRPNVIKGGKIAAKPFPWRNAQAT